MNKLNTAPTLTHDEIALHAFLIWERDGRHPGREQTYWLQAETHLRLTRQQLAERASSQSTRTWPPQTAAAPKPTRARAVTPVATKTAKPAATSRTMKPATVAKPATRKGSSSSTARKSLGRN